MLGKSLVVSPRGAAPRVPSEARIKGFGIRRGTPAVAICLLRLLG